MKSDSSIEFGLTWSTPVAQAEGGSRAMVCVALDGLPIWPSMGDPTDAFECFAEDILAHLSESWKALALRQIYPIPVQPERPSLLRAEAEKRWADRPTGLVEAEEERVAAFEDVHNFANAFGGTFGLPPLWLLRSQDLMAVDTGTRVWWLPYRQAIAALTACGDDIANRLRAADPLRWSALLDAWARRDISKKADILAWSLGVDRTVAQALIDDGTLDSPDSVSAAANDNDEPRVAARMTGWLRLEQIRAIVRLVRNCPRHSAPALDELADGLASHLAAQNIDQDSPQTAYPFEQGTIAARWLRSRLARDRRLDPFYVLKQLGVDTRAHSIDPASLDAIAVWGQHHGPAVLLNTASTRFRGRSESIWRDGAARVTAAHEICHLLLDRGHALTAVDILQSRMPVHIEQRARAFAAEFLLPAADAVAAWTRHGTPLERARLDRVVRHLCKRFGVTRSVAAWQLEHGVDRHVQSDISAILDEVVPHR